MSYIVALYELARKNLGWVACAVVAVIAAYALYSAGSRAERVEAEQREEFRLAYESYADSMAKVRHSDSVAFQAEVYSLRHEAERARSERDSIEMRLSTQTATSKVVYRTVYRDSVREVTVENSETATYYEARLAHVTDSLERIIDQKDGVTVEYVDKVVHDTVVVYKERVDSVQVVNTVEKVVEVRAKDGNVGIYADAAAGYGTDGFRYGAGAGMKYYLVGPVYGRAGVRYDGDLSGELGVGLDIRF